MDSRVKFNVGGQVYSISLDALKKGPSSKLTQMYTSGRAVTESRHIEIDRPADLFASVLALYQTGELHFPMTSCPGAFLNELEFWDIAPEVVASCCYERLESFVDEQGILKQFRESRENNKKHSCYSDELEKSFEGTLWNIIDYAKPSFLGKMYLVISLSMVLLSIFILAFSTDPYFRRKMTNCERLEFMESSGMGNFELAKKWLTHDCENDAFPDHPKPIHLTRPDTEDDNECSRTRVFTRYEKYETVYLHYDDFEHQNQSNKSNFTVISANVTAETAESYAENNITAAPALQEQTEPTTLPIDTLKASHVERNNSQIHLKHKGDFVKLPDFKIRINAFVILDTVTLVYFTFDVLLRLIFCPSRKYFFFSIINFIDVLALFATYTHIVLMQAFKHKKYMDTWFDVLKYFQVLRSLRLFRIVSNVRAGQILAYTIRVNFKDLLILVFFLVVGISSFASCIFLAEEREDIQSIPVGWYWALITMTTVGYGDITPKSALGRVILCICAFAGIILLALTVPIFANNFLTLYKFASSEKTLQKYVKTNVKVKERDKHEKKMFCKFK